MKIAIATTISSNIVSLVIEVLPWMLYHTTLGVAVFYIMIDATKVYEMHEQSVFDIESSREIVTLLKSLNHVHVELLAPLPKQSIVERSEVVSGHAKGKENINIDFDNDVAFSAHTAEERDLLREFIQYYNTHSQWKNQPGNYELMTCS